MLLFNEEFDRHQQMLKKYAQEQQDLLYEVDQIERFLQKNEENNEKVLEALFLLKERESTLDNRMMDVHKKIADLESKSEEQITKQQRLIKEIENNRMNMNALSVLNIIQFMIIILLFFMNGESSSIFPKIICLIILLVIGIGLLFLKKK